MPHIKGMNIKTIDIMNYYFSRMHQEHMWSCNLCQRQIKQKQNSGYSNLTSHITSHKSNYKELYVDNLKRSGMKRKIMDNFGFVDDKVKDMYEWITWIVSRNLPLCEVENQKTRDVVKMRSFSVETL